MNTTNKPAPETNPDPITGAPGAHPVGVGIGAASAGATGAGIGAAVGGPVGAVVGAAVGGLVGGLAGKGVAEAIDPTAEETYWRTEHANQPYATASDTTYDDYAPAYRTGYLGHRPGTDFATDSSRLRDEYERNRGKSRLSWEQARPAAERAWTRVDRGEAKRLPVDRS